MHITSHNSRSVISRCSAKCPSLVGWLFWFVLFLRIRKAILYVCTTLSVCPFCLPPPFSPLNILNLFYERIQYITCPWACSIHSQQRYLNDPVEILSVTSLLQSHLHSHRAWPEMENRSSVVVTCSFCVVQQWAIKYEFLFWMILPPSSSFVSLLGNINLCASRQCNTIGRASSQSHVPVSTRILAFYSSRHAAHCATLFSHCSYPLA